MRRPSRKIEPASIQDCETLGFPPFELHLARFTLIWVRLPAATTRCPSGEVAVEPAAMPDTSRHPKMSPLPLSFDGPLGQKIIEPHVWAVR